MTNGVVTILRRYGLFGFVRLGIDLLCTRMHFRNARLIRSPAYVRGKRSIRVGSGFTTGVGLRLDAFPREPQDDVCIEIGNNVQLNDYVHIGAIKSVRIGDNVLIASKVYISDHNHGRYSGPGEHDSPDMFPSQRQLDARPIIIEDNVWLGESVAVLPGVRIGRGAVIGAMSVVTHDIPSATLAVGVPARVIKIYDPAARQWVPIKRD